MDSQSESLYLLDSDLSEGWRHTPFEPLGPE